MLIVISPAKNMNFKRPTLTGYYTLPVFEKESRQIMEVLRDLTLNDIREIMDVNNSLAILNYERYHIWHQPFTTDNALQAILAFNGEVYNGMKAREWENKDLLYAQEHLRILSGLHGILRPLDLIQPYRLEMGIEIEINGAGNLFDFWGDKILRKIKSELQEHKTKVIVNLSSNEYAKAAQLNKTGARIITPVFKQLQGDKFKMIVVYLKKARGMMSRFIIENRIEDPESLKLFDAEDYFYNEKLSDESEWVFTR